MIQQLSIFAAAVVVCATSLTVRPPSCSRQAQRCMLPLMPFATLGGGDRSQLANRTVVESAATGLQQASSCLDQAASQTGCGNLLTSQTMFTGVQFLSRFLNTEGTVDKVVAAATSPCLMSEPLIEEMGEAGETCLRVQEPVLQTTGNLCTVIRNSFRCIKRSAQQICGDEVSDLLQALWDFFYQEQNRTFMAEFVMGGNDGSMNLDCWDHVTLVRRYAQAALPESVYKRFVN